MLIEWPAEESSRDAVLFSKVSGKLRLKKLTARVQKQKKAYEKQVFGTDAIKIIWRDPTDEELDAEAKLTACLDEEFPAHLQPESVFQKGDEENAMTKENVEANIMNVVA